MHLSNRHTIDLIQIHVLGMVMFFQLQIVTTDFGMAVRWDGYHQGDVKTPGTYKGTLRGLCGDYNDVADDDFTDLEGRLVNLISVSA